MIYIYPANSIARELIIEKEERQREAMEMMGLPSWINWAAWSVTSGLPHTKSNGG